MGFCLDAMKTFQIKKDDWRDGQKTVQMVDYYAVLMAVVKVDLMVLWMGDLGVID